MIGYVTLGTKDLNRAAEFYDALLSELGCGRFMEDPGKFIAWANPANPKGAGLGITYPFNGEAMTVGNGVMVALEAKDTDTVDKVYHKALELGGTCEGKPGERFPGFYAGYFRDLDGNKLNVFIMTQA